MVTAIGNHGLGYATHGSHVSGVGIQQTISGEGYLAVAGKTGEVFYGQLTSILRGDINSGIFFQSSIGATVEFTLCEPNLATNTDPDVQASVLWGNSLTVPGDGTIVPSDVLCNCFKVTFSGTGLVYILAK